MRAPAGTTIVTSDNPERALTGSVGSFYSLSLERVLEAVELAGYQTTGLCYALNSLENRVYEVELDDRRRVICKFYRPGRWSRETILDEHRLLAALVAAEVPVCAPIAFADGDTLHNTPEQIQFALFPRTGGRSPDELSIDALEQLGRLLGRIHNVSASLGLQHRPTISPQTYGRECLALIVEGAEMPDALRQRYADAVEQIIAVSEPRFAGVETFVLHGDCHRGNLLFGSDGWFFLDFDDMASAPAAQDFWLLLPARRSDSEAEIDALLRGYEQFREIDRASLRLIEPLRALRYVRYAAWVTSRWQDPSFPRAFPQWGTDNYWQGQLGDLYEQLRVIMAEDSLDQTWE